MTTPSDKCKLCGGAGVVSVGQKCICQYDQNTMTTPRTNAAHMQCLDDAGGVTRLEPIFDLSRQLEQELAAMTEERDRLLGLVALERRLCIEAQSKIEEERKRGDEYGQKYAKLLLEFQKLKQERDQLRAELERVNRRDGSWLDPDGACRVCGGEIPHGHTGHCDIYKLEQERDQLRAELNTIRSVLVKDLDRDKDDTTTPHLAVVAMNSLVRLRAELEAFKQLHPDYRKEAQ